MEYKTPKRGRINDAFLIGYKRCRRGGVDDELILRLPNHLISDILSRLPVESVCCCKCVCKTLETISREPYFAELHLAKATKTDQRLIIQNKANPSCFFLIHKPELENTSSDPCPWKKTVVPSVTSKLKPFQARLLGACNGLICLLYSTIEHHMFYICNPVLGEFMLLPQPKHCAYITMFGACPNTKQFKVIQFSRPVSKVYGDICEIHTVGTKDWRMIENVPPPRYMDYSYLNGNLHWISGSNRGSLMICSFNLEAEQVSVIPSPVVFYRRQFSRKLQDLWIGVIDGLLYVGHKFDAVKFDVFVMKDYGVKDSWTKKATIDLNFLQISQFKDSWTKQLDINLKFTSDSERKRWERTKYKNPYSITFLDNGDMLLKYLYFPLIYYNPEKGIAWDLMELGRKGRRYDRVFGSYDSCYCLPSFISLKEIAKEEDVEVVTLEKLQDIWSYDRVPKSYLRLS